MAHRGRLSVLAHNLGRSVESIMAEFEGAKALERGEGGWRRSRTAAPATSSTTTAPRACSRPADGERSRSASIPNPSHLEFVDPVVTGGTRAAQTAHSGPQPHHDPKRRRAAAAARRRRVPRPGRRRRDAQPAVARGLLDRRHDPHHHRQPGGLHHRSRGGSLDPYAADMAKGFNVPIIHVNADDVGGLHRRDPAGDGVPRALGPRRRHRPDRLPPLRPQRDRRARLHAAEDGRPDQGAPAGLARSTPSSWSRRAWSPPRTSRREHRADAEELSGDPQGAASEDGGRASTRTATATRSAPASSTARRARTSTPRSRRSACGP